jgi:hypothetical protein
MPNIEFYLKEISLLAHITRRNVGYFLSANNKTG